MKKIVLLFVIILGATCCNAQRNVRVAVPNTQLMVKNALAKSRARRAAKGLKSTRSSSFNTEITNKFLQWMRGNAAKGTSTNNDSAYIAKQAIAKKALSNNTGNEVTALDVMNMMSPGLFTDKEKEQWKALPSDTRKAIINGVLATGPTNWDMLNDAQKAVISDASNGK